jgi:hypothetical protein
VPVILVTALDSFEDQAGGTERRSRRSISKGAFNDERVIVAVRSFV